MKKILFIVALMLMVAVQSMNAQSEIVYSLEGIGKTLNKFDLTSSDLCLGDFHEGFAWFRVGSGENERYGFIDNQGNMISPRFKKVKNFSEGLACVGDDNWKFGFIDKQGKTVIPLSYGEHTRSFSDGLALVRIISSDDSFAYINKNGEIVIPQFKAYRAYSFNGGIAPIEGTKRNTHFIDTKGNVVIQSQPYRNRGFKDGFYSMDKYVIDTKGNVVVPANYYSMAALSEGLCGVEIRKEKRDASGYSVKFLWGFYDIEKNVEAIQPKFDDVRMFSEGFAAVQIGKKWGYINKQGEMVIACNYKSAYDFHKGVAFVNIDESYAIIDKQGNIITRLPNYDYFSGHFSEGLAVISQNGKWGYVDIYGNSTFNPKTMGNANTQDRDVTNKTPITCNSSFVGGEAAMRKFIASTMKYPVIAEENGEQGDVVVGFTVEADGTLTNIHIVKSVSEWLDKEAKKIVSKMPNWQPAQSGGENVKSEQTVEVKFRLE